MPFESSGFGVTVADLDENAADEAAPRGKDLVLVFVTREDRRVRPEHAALHGRVWELDDHSAPVPPLAYGCRCEVQIQPRKIAEKRERDDAEESLKRFPKLKENLAEYFPEDVAEEYGKGNLKPGDLIIPRTGDRISTEQARAIISARKHGASVTAGLQAVTLLTDRGISGTTLWKIVTAAKQGIASGQTPIQAATEAFRDTERRGLVTSKTTAKAAAELVATGLLK